MPGWQKVYEELKDEGFEIVAAAQDTGGIEHAGPFYEKANATFTTLIDRHHVVSSLYNMVNVPLGVWVDEEGRVVRAPEVAYSKKVSLLGISVEGDRYVNALRDWVKKGPESVYAMQPEDVVGHIEPKSKDAALAEANFRLGLYFHDKSNGELAVAYWKKAEQLRPDSWNYHRQDWAFTPAIAGRNWMTKFRALDGKDYYTPLDLPPAEE